MKQMDQQLKERLVGAAVLVILGMLLIPSLLNGPPEDEPVRIGVELPAPGQDGKRSQTVRITVPADRPNAGSISRPVETNPAITPTPAKPEPAPNERQQKTESQEQPAAIPPPAPAVPPREAPSMPRAHADGWAVQVGSFSNQENAERLSSELAKGGYDVFVDRAVTTGKTWYRVRVGPVPDKETAEALATRLQAGGQTARVVPNEG
jgi:DedD protein